MEILTEFVMEILIATNELENHLIIYFQVKSNIQSISFNISTSRFPD